MISNREKEGGKKKEKKKRKKREKERGPREIFLKKGKLQFTPMKLSLICNSNTNVSILLIAPH
jgi:hypothetical protein